MITVRRVGCFMGAMLALVAIVLAKSANAEPPRDFPDVDTLTAITDTEPFEMSGRWGWAIQFTASDGSISCMFSAQASCSGQIPTIPQALPGAGEGDCPYVSNSGNTLSDDKPYAFTRGGGSCPPFVGKPLNAGQKLVTPYMTCGAFDAGVVACIDSERRHGFVIRPSGSAAF